MKHLGFVKQTVILNLVTLLLTGTVSGQTSQASFPSLNPADLVFTAAVANDPRCQMIVTKSIQAAATLNIITEVSAESFCINKANMTHTWSDSTFQRFVALRTRAKYPQWTSQIIAQVPTFPAVIEISNADLNLDSSQATGPYCMFILRSLIGFGPDLGLMMNLSLNECQNSQVTLCPEQINGEWLASKVTAKFPSWLHPLTPAKYGYRSDTPSNVCAQSAQIRDLVRMLDNARTLKGKSDEEYSDLLNQTYIERLIERRIPRTMSCRNHSVYLPPQRHQILPQEFNIVSLQCFTSAERDEVYYYRGVGYSNMNAQLRRNSVTDGMRNKVSILTSALDKLNPIEVISFRGSNTPQFFENYQKGNIVSDLGFISSSLDSATAAAFGSAVRIIMLTRTCPYITNVTLTPDQVYGNGENEVLCKPGTQFEVLHRENRNNVNFIILEEVPSSQSDNMNVEF
ncbi:MAG: ADP-ribosyltransferase [Pseudobdellovibrionaceae bacterium]